MKNIFALLLFVAFGSVNAQENLNYQKPAKSILDLADYERAPSVSMDTKKEYMLLSYRNTYKTLDDLSQEEMRLGGLRINPVTNISSTTTYISNLKIRKIKGTAEMQVKGLPENAKLSNISWSPNEKKISFSNTTATGVELWVIDVASAEAKRLTDAKVNSNMGNPFSWFKDNEHILVRMLPKNRAALIDVKKDLPLGPIVSTADGSVSQNRTYQDLLKNKTDETNFETLVTSELYKVDLNGSAQLFMNADLYAGENFSPDGNYLMVTTIEKPFSYIVPLSRFPNQTIIYDAGGKQVKVVNESPLNEIMPKGFMAVKKGKRSMNWRSDAPATLYYAEALDEGNPANKVDFRDEVFTWEAPFSQAPKSFVKTVQRYGGITWGDATTAILSDYWYDTRNEKTYMMNPSALNDAPKLIWDRNSQDIYSDPGSFETVKNQYGRYVLAIENNKAFLIGQGHTKEGQFPFIDQFDLKTFKTSRLYQSNYKDKVEAIFSIEDFKKGDVLVQIQSKTEYPNYYFRNIKKTFGKTD